MCFFKGLSLLFVIFVVTKDEAANTIVIGKHAKLSDEVGQLG